MRLQFDSEQEHQKRAVKAVLDLFEGQSQFEDGPAEVAATGAHSERLFATQPNPPLLGDGALLANLQKVQAENGLAPDAALARIEEQVGTDGDRETVSFPNFTVEMETGTGKTYAYLRTAIELHETYGMRKFIIVVPSVAIREGVLKTLEITREHFDEVYQRPGLSFRVYDSGNTNQVKAFAEEDGLQILVMTLQSFGRDTTILRQSRDDFSGDRPIHALQATRPILILDEPQNMETARSREALALLKPLFALRYSATHRERYNLIYRLTPFDAYRSGLVKKIEVAGFEGGEGGETPFVQLETVTVSGQTPRARLQVHVQSKDGTVSQGTVTVKPEDDLEAKTGLPSYRQLQVEEIDPYAKLVRFTNGLELVEGQSVGADKDALWEAQIKYTIEEHFQKQRQLRTRGIKVLSLFFIDRVANYAQEDGIIRKLFWRCFREVAGKYPADCEAWWGTQEPDPATVQAAYFATRRTRQGDEILEDSSTGNSEKDREAYDLIMKRKEALLSFEEPVSFIFSHSALREGWDNPNIFQICTLNQTASTMKKRQEIGRGVRLAVNQAGERPMDERMNILTVAANESYTRYVEALQSELEEEGYSRDQQAPQRNALERTVVRAQAHVLVSEAFRELWERIKHRTRYRVQVDTGSLVDDVVNELGKRTIPPPRVTVQKVGVRLTDDDALTVVKMTGVKTAIDLTGRYPLPNLVLLMEDLLRRGSSPPMRLSRNTLLSIYRKTPNRAQAAANPQEFARVAVEIIRQKLLAQLVAGIEYERIGSHYCMKLFENERNLFAKHIVPASDRCVYDHVACDSDVERTFAEDLKDMDWVKLYVKLPSWFTLPTPLGTYNPDWAVVVEPRDEYGTPTGEEFIYLVAETKGDAEQLRPAEVHKIHCGKAHFEGALDGVRFEGPVSEASELPTGHE